MLALWLLQGLEREDKPQVAFRPADITSLQMCRTVKIKASQLPDLVSIELRHLKEGLFRDPRRCPLALALREALSQSLGQEPQDTAVWEFHTDVVLNRQHFQAQHSNSVLEFVRHQDDRSRGEAPRGLYFFDWYAVVKRKHRARDITELIGS
jgi:hypothetical protein